MLVLLEGEVEFRTQVGSGLKRGQHFSQRVDQLSEVGLHLADQLPELMFLEGVVVDDLVEPAARTHIQVANRRLQSDAEGLLLTRVTDCQIRLNDQLKPRTHLDCA